MASLERKAKLLIHNIWERGKGHGTSGVETGRKEWGLLPYLPIGYKDSEKKRGASESKA